MAVAFSTGFMVGRTDSSFGPGPGATGPVSRVHPSADHGAWRSHGNPRRLTSVRLPAGDPPSSHIPSGGGGGRSFLPPSLKVLLMQSSSWISQV
jgi:hypothetical protein